MVDNEGFRIPRRFVTRDAVDDELERLDRAFEGAAKEIALNRDKVAQQLGDDCGAIFSAQLQMLRDNRLRHKIEASIRDEHYSPEYAVSCVLREYAKVFQNLEDQYLAERAFDIIDIEKRLLRHLLGQQREVLGNLVSPVVVLAHNLTPSETANLDRERVLGFVTEIGGPGSHTAIVAEAMAIPAVVGLGQFLTDLSGGDTVIIDGDQGLIILQPDKETLERYHVEARQHDELARRLETLHDVPAITADGVPLQLLANIEFPYEAAASLQKGADGIGLYRTEFLYLGAKAEPTEEIHFQAYTQVSEAAGDRPVVIRTLDLGADKMGHLPQTEDEQNPFLGLRSIRLSLRHLPLFRTQLRAILRASAIGNFRIMFPLISTLPELRLAKSVLSDVMEDLEDENTPFDRDIPVGIMIEVPSAVMIIDRLVTAVDFISIGTNDLIQYTLAVDRGNKEVASLYNASDPAVLRMIKTSIDAARHADIGVSLCGLMSGNPIYTMLLTGLGLRAMSMTPQSVSEIKEIARNVTIPQCEELADRAMAMEDAVEIKRFLREELRKATPEIVSHS